MPCRVSSKTLSEVMHFKLSKLGVSKNHANMLVDGLVKTSLRGIDTHGLRLFPLYLREFEQGRCKISPELKWSNRQKATVLMDADGANGVVAGISAMDRAISLASDFGIGMVVVQNSNHFAAASIYSMKAVQLDFIGLCMTNSDALVGLENGKIPFIGTNPIAFAAPGAKENDCFDLDMATSQISYSKVMNYLSRSLPLEPGWAVNVSNDDSQPEYILSALGGYKGQGIGMMVQIMTALLANMPFDHELTHLYSAPYDTPRQVSYTMIAIDPSTFIELDVFKQRLSELMQLAREQSSEIILPGDKERQSTAEREQEGIPLSEEEEDWFKNYQNEMNLNNR